MKRGKLIRARLFRVRRAKLVNDLVALLLLAIGLAAFGVAIVAFVFWSGWVVLIFAVPVAWFGRRWLRGLSIKALARDVEKHFPEVQGKLVPALELAEYRPDRREGYSEELIQAAVSEVEKAVAPLALEGLTFGESVDNGRYAKMGRWACFVISGLSGTKSADFKPDCCGSAAARFPVWENKPAPECA